MCVHFFHLFLDLIEIVLRYDCLHRRLDTEIREKAEPIKHVYVVVALVNG